MLLPGTIVGGRATGSAVTTAFSFSAVLFPSSSIRRNEVLVGSSMGPPAIM